MSESRRSTFDEVLQSARQGAPWALGSLYRAFQPGLLKLLGVIAPHHAEDIASDVWLEVAGALTRFSGDERAFRGLLATTARRRVIDSARRAGRRPVRARSAGTAAGRPGSEQAEDESAEHLAVESAIARVVEVLPPEQADVVLMRAVGGLDVEQVARALGKQPGAVRSLQHRALRRLARQLRPGTLSA